MKRAVAKNKDVVWRKIEDKVVLIGKEGAAIHTLNRTASQIWEYCDGINGPDEIAANLCERFDVLPEQANTDVRETLGKLEQMGLVEMRDKIIESKKGQAF